MAHPDKDSGTEQEDRFMQNLVKSRRSRSLAVGHATQSRRQRQGCEVQKYEACRSEVYGAIAPLFNRTDLFSERTTTR